MIYMIYISNCKDCFKGLPNMSINGLMIGRGIGSKLKGVGVGAALLPGGFQGPDRAQIRVINLWELEHMVRFVVLKRFGPLNYKMGP